MARRASAAAERASFDKFVDEPLCCDGRPAREALGSKAHRLGAYQASLIADLRDPDRAASRRLPALRVAGGEAGGDPTTQLMPELRGYLPLAGFVAAARVRLGEIIELRPGDVPAIERYYSGGTSGQRGFSERYLAPRVDAMLAGGCANAGASTVIGGAALIEAGVELRRQLASLGSVPVGTNLFLDGASVTCRPEQLDPMQLEWAIGAGLWGKVAGLKIHADLGYRLNGRDLSPGPGSFGNFAWHIGGRETY